jgi:hypothetical protein
MCPKVTPLIFESGYQKLASYTIGDRTKHIARQLTRTPDQQIGGNLDISHVLSGLESEEYGNVVFETKNRRARNSLGVTTK